ncbi:RNA-directed DNA polymerase, eukaryota, reverse transcriptase zinc-binding domain protein [Tanacetum coccineum]
MWVMLMFKSMEEKENFKLNVGIGSWFSKIIQTTYDFIVDGRVAWVEVEGIPLKVWIVNSFKKIASKWGSFLSADNSEEDCYHSKRLCILTAAKDNIMETIKITFKGKSYWLRVKEVPGWYPDFDEQGEEASAPKGTKRYGYGEFMCRVRIRLTFLTLQTTQMESIDLSSIISKGLRKGLNKIIEIKLLESHLGVCSAKIILKSKTANLGIIHYGHAIDSWKGSEVHHKLGRFQRDIQARISVAAARHFFHSGTIPKGCNSSFIALIPKIPDAKMVKDFRPISLISSLYKIIAKILANRLVTVLGDLINEVQSAVVADRQILDGPFILNELLQWCKLKKKQSFIFKIDFEKAFDSVRWDHLDEVNQVAYRIGCGILKVPFTYLGSKVGGCMSRSQAWSDVIAQMNASLSKWKMKTLSIGGRLTLLKSVLGSMLIYHMSIFKVPMGILCKMESIKSRFFYGINKDGNKAVWVNWNKVLVAKVKGGLGARVITAIHGIEGNIGSHSKKFRYKSLWRDIVSGMEDIKKQGADLRSFIHKKIGNGSDTNFWEDSWNGFSPLNIQYPRLFALETDKQIKLADKLNHPNLFFSFRRDPRGGVEASQLGNLMSQLEGVTLGISSDRWVWSLVGTGEFSVASVRKLINDIKASRSLFAI